MAFHWQCMLWPESRNAWPTFSPVLGDLTEHFTVLGHGHPRILRSLVPTYARYGIEVVEDFDEVLERAQVLAVDNSSVGPEFASTGRPVVWMNAPHYRRDVHHGGRFWIWPEGQVQCDDPGDLVDAVYRALADPPEVSAARGRMVDAVYPIRDGRAAERGADAIRRLVAESDFTPRRDPVPHNPKAARTGGGARRLPEVQREEPQALTGVVTPALAVSPALPEPGTVAYASFIALFLHTDRVRGADGEPLDLPWGNLDDAPQSIRG